LEDGGRRLNGRVPPARKGWGVRYLCSTAGHGDQRLPEPAVGTESTGPIAAGTSTGAPSEVLQGPAIEGALGTEPVQKATPTPSTRTSIASPGTERINGTKRLYAGGNFNSKDGKATFIKTRWRGLQAPGKEAEMRKWPFLINNGRTNHVWQSAYLNQANRHLHPARCRA
jgi:arsenite oxidase large subunit